MFLHRDPELELKQSMATFDLKKGHIGQALALFIGKQLTTADKDAYFYVLGCLFRYDFHRDANQVIH